MQQLIKEHIKITIINITQEGDKPIIINNNNNRNKPIININNIIIIEEIDNNITKEINNIETIIINKQNNNKLNHKKKHILLKTHYSIKPKPNLIYLNLISQNHLVNLHSKTNLTEEIN